MDIFAERISEITNRKRDTAPRLVDLTDDLLVFVSQIAVPVPVKINDVRLVVLGDDLSSTAHT